MEIWKPISRLPGYEVSNIGNVRSLKNNKVRNLSISENNRGYLLCCLYHNKHRHTSYVHRLVAEAFIPTNRDTQTLEVNHKDKNPKNNHVDNLEWTTGFENSFHKIDPNRYFLIERLKLVVNKMSNEELENLITKIE